MSQAQPQDNRMFQEMKKAAWERLRSCDPLEIAKKAGVLFDEKERVFSFASLGKQIRVNYPGFQVEGALGNGMSWLFCIIWGWLKGRPFPES